MADRQDRFVKEINEASSGRYSSIILDEDDQPVPLSAITDILLTVIERGTLNVVNERAVQNVKNLNGVTYHPTSGALVWTITPDDTEIINPATKVDEFEEHLATFTITWDDGAKATHREVLLKVKNLISVGD